MEVVKLDRWGYEVNTSSDACIAAINSYYDQALSYGRKRGVILEAPKADPFCVLGNILAAHFLCSHDPSQGSRLLDAAKNYLENGSAYERAVFNAVSYFFSPNWDDYLAVEMHSKLLKDYPKDLVSLKRVQVLCFYIGRPDLSLQLVEQVFPQNKQENFIYGMLAFPLLELGRMLDAENAAKKRIQINKDDPWSQHAYFLFSICRLCLMPEKKQRLMQRGMLLAEALYEYGKGENAKALELLGLQFDVIDLKIIGASDEQFDIFNEIWLALLINTGHATTAIEAIEKQLKKRGVQFLWRLLEKSYRMLERPEAAHAGERAHAY